MAATTRTPSVTLPRPRDAVRPQADVIPGHMVAIRQRAVDRNTVVVASDHVTVAVRRAADQVAAGIDDVYAVAAVAAAAETGS